MKGEQEKAARFDTAVNALCFLDVWDLVTTAAAIGHCSPDAVTQGRTQLERVLVAAEADRHSPAPARLSIGHFERQGHLCLLTIPTARRRAIAVASCFSFVVHAARSPRHSGEEPFDRQRQTIDADRQTNTRPSFVVGKTGDRTDARQRTRAHSQTQAIAPARTRSFSLSVFVCV